jgi:hypothetical protein
MKLTREQIAILNHTSTRTAGGLYCGDSSDMQELIKQGLMISAGKKSFVPDEYFRLTAKGKQELREIADKEARKQKPASKEGEEEICVLCGKQKQYHYRQGFTENYPYYCKPPHISKVQFTPSDNREQVSVDRHKETNNMNKPTEEDKRDGLKAKYNITHVDGSPCDPNAQYFVLRLDYHNDCDKKHVAACRVAAKIYAKEIVTHLPLLSSDLQTMLMTDAPAPVANNELVALEKRVAELEAQVNKIDEYIHESHVPDIN